jgi:DNA-binding FadR family transcriptional regulator
VSPAGDGQPPPARSLDRRGASEQVADEIERYIEEQGLGPGDRLGREEDLASSFGVSRPTLREALKLLAKGTRVRSTKGPGGGIFVANTAEAGVQQSLSDSIALMLETGVVDLQELLDTRILLEVPLAGLAAYNNDAKTIERMRGAIARAENAGEGDFEALLAADREIHQAVAAAADNRIMEALTGWVLEVHQPTLVDQLSGALITSAVIEQHRILLIERGDGPRAERAMKDHLLYLRDVLRMVQAGDGEVPHASGGNGEDN